MAIDVSDYKTGDRKQSFTALLPKPGVLIAIGLFLIAVSIAIKVIVPPMTTPMPVATSTAPAPKFDPGKVAADVLKGTSKGRLVVQSAFDGPEGLTGLVVLNSESNQKLIAWAAGTGKTIIFGPVMDSAGENLTYNYQQKLTGHAFPVQSDMGAAADPEKPDPATFEAVKTLKSIIVGNPNASKNLYVFYDAQCSNCRLAHNQLKPFEGQIAVHYIPVAMIGNDDYRRAAALLLANSKQAMDETSNSGVWPQYSDQQLEPFKNDVTANNAMVFTLLGKGATPLMAYESNSFKGPRVVLGAPESEQATQSLIEDIAR